jgi:peptidyl-prolyl cis-trans isomerase C
MRSRPGAALVFLVTSAGAAAATNLRALADPRLEAGVARVGPTSITVGDLEQRMRAIPDFQLAAFGPSPQQIREKVLEVMIEEALFAEGARIRKLEQTAPVREKIQEALRAARVGLLRDETTVKAADVEAFYRDNRARFDTPPRINISRILCTTREEAVSVLSQAKALGGVPRWNELAREHSADKTSSMRGGSLGFVAADGSSSEANVRVNPALFSAAERVKDGEFVPEPVGEGKFYGVVWRRGSLPAVHRTVEDEASAIRQILMRQRIAEALRSLLDRLRSEEKIERAPQLLDVLEVEPTGEVAQRKRPGVAERRRPAAAPGPTMTPRGLR